ncbi:MAG: substrate-binding periplasmic protein [Bdellovibrionales bacterium]
MKKALLVLLCLAAGFFGATVAVRTYTPGISHESAYDRVMRTGTLRCGYFLWPKFVDKDPNTGALSGIAFDVAESVAQKFGLKVEWTEVAIGSEVEALQTTKVDAICAANGPFNWKSAAYEDFVTPFAKFRIDVYGRANETRFKIPADLNSPDVTFSALDGDLSTVYAVESFPQAKMLSLPNMADPSLLVLNVIDNKADVVLVDPVTVSMTEAQYPGAIKPLFARPYGFIPTGMSVGKNQHALLQMLNQGMEILFDVGIMDKILDKYDPERKLAVRRDAPEWEQ